MSLVQPGLWVTSCRRSEQTISAVCVVWALRRNRTAQDHLEVQRSKLVSGCPPLFSLIFNTLITELNGNLPDLSRRDSDTTESLQEVGSGRR